MNRLISLVLMMTLVVLAGCGRNPPRSTGAQQGGYVAGTRPMLGDSRPHAWTAGHPYNNEIHGIDISRYQGQINWQQVRSAGINFVFIKATEGGDHSDPAFRTYWDQAGAAGIPRGAYHYYYFCRSGAQQAAWFIANVPRGTNTLPPVIDLEWTSSRTCPRRPSPAEVKAEATAFMNALQQFYGQRPIIYTTVDFYRDNQLGTMREEFWLRSTANHPSATYPGQRWTFWQYSGTGTVPGIRGNVDLNTFAGSAAQWNQWLRARMR